MTALHRTRVARLEPLPATRLLSTNGSLVASFPLRRPERVCAAVSGPAPCPTTRRPRSHACGVAGRRAGLSGRCSGKEAPRDLPPFPAAVAPRGAAVGDAVTLRVLPAAGPVRIEVPA